MKIKRGIDYKRESFGVVMEMSYILIVVMILQLYVLPFTKLYT